MRDGRLPDPAKVFPLSQQCDRRLDACPRGGSGSYGDDGKAGSGEQGNRGVRKGPMRNRRTAYSSGSFGRFLKFFRYRVSLYGFLFWMASITSTTTACPTICFA